MRFFLGTRNQYKVQEHARILNPLQLKLLVIDAPDPEETESNFEGNAIIKAQAYCSHIRDQQMTGLAKRCGGRDGALNFMRAARYWIISEDSGLIVPALGGLPGPWSARLDDFAEVDTHVGTLAGYVATGRGRDEIDLANNRRVLELMRAVPFERRAAYFAASLIVVDIDGQVLFRGLGKCEGWIADEMRGSNGFGYDPIFVHGRMPNHTFAELDRQRKDLLSHRRQVLTQFTAWLGTQLRDMED
ncbi:MAG: non-canonical purine NTP pyrophosphatase [Patescibacteria group bacterium]